MATWNISNEIEKNVVEFQTFTKNNMKVVRSQCYTWGTWTCQNDTKPSVDLANQAGFNPSESTECNWQQSAIVDEQWTKWAFAVGMSQEEQQRIQALWASNGEQGLINDGFVKSGVDYKIYGSLKLVNQDTGESFVKQA